MRTHRLAGLAVGCLLALHLSAGLASAQNTKARQAEVVLTEIKDLKPPTLDPKDRRNEEAVAKYREEMKKVASKRADLAWEFYHSDPKDLAKIDPKQEELGRLLQARWSFLAQTDNVDQVLTETRSVMKDNKGEPIASTAAFIFADVTGDKEGADSQAFAKAVDDFRAIDPKNDRGAYLYMTMADAAKTDADKKKIYNKVIELYPDSRTGKMAAGQIKRMEGVGKPFELSFTDAISGKTIEMKDLKGKVVVVDFWATWCGPCVGEMPHMKELYAKYNKQGVEFIGISLDNPEETGKGLTKLKEFVDKNEIKWPQYYQGKGWDSEFSGSWGINSIPALFVVDKKGNLHTTEGRGKLEELLPKLLGAT